MVKRRQRRNPWRRRLFRLAGILIVAILVGLVVAVSSFNKNMYDELLADRLESALGRSLAIDGELSVALSLEPEITATQVRFANPSWASTDDMLTISEIHAKIALLPLLTGELTLLQLTMDQVDANLELAADGQANWNLESDGDEAGGSFHVTLPDDLTIKRLNVTYADNAIGETHTGWFDDVHLASSSSNLDVTTTGQVDDTPVSVDLNLPSLEAIIDPDLNTPVKGEIAALGLNLKIDGEVGLSEQGAPTGSADIVIDSQDISSISVLAGVALPAEPFHFSGTASLADTAVTAKGDATLADTSATIDVTIGTDTTPSPISGSASISGSDTAWIAKLAAISLPESTYSLDAQFDLDEKLQANGNATLGDVKVTFDVTDATWDGIPPQTLTLALEGPDMSKLGDWLDIRLPAVAFDLSLDGAETGSTFNVTNGKVTAGDASGTFSMNIVDLNDPFADPTALQFTTGNAQAVGNLYDIDLPALPFDISTNLTIKGDLYDLGSLKAAIGGQDLTGSLKIDDTQDRTSFAGNLATGELDIATISDALNSDDIAEDEPLLIPDPGIDLDVTFSATTVTYDDAQFENAHFQIRTNDHDVGLYGLTAIFAGGKLTSDLTVTHSVSNPPISGTLKLVSASTTDISTMFGLPGDVRGPLNIDVEMDSDTTSANQTIEDVTGHADIVLQDGYVGSDVLRKADSFVNLLAPWRNKKDPSEVSCLVLRYDVADAKATSEVTLLDTSTMTVAGTGYIDLQNDTFQLRLVPTPKDANLLSLATAVTITGPISDPSLGVGPLDVATGAAGSVLGSILTPIKMLLPILGLQDSDDSVCQAALDPNRGASNAATPGASQCARPYPWTDYGNARIGRHKQHNATC